MAKRTLSRGSGGSEKKKSGPVALLIPLIGAIVTPLELAQSDEDQIKEELSWLLHAANHVLEAAEQIKQGATFASMENTVDVPIPSHAQQTVSQANNQILTDISRLSDKFVDTMEEYVQYELSGSLKSTLRIIERTHLKNLGRLLARAASFGDEAAADQVLQNELKDERIDISKKLDELAQSLNDVYGVLITAPDQLVAHLEDRTLETSPIAVGGLVQSQVVPTFDLDQDSQDWINEELNWLFSAADNLLEIYKKSLAENTIDRSQPIPVPVPPDAEVTAPDDERNYLLSSIEHIELKSYDSLLKYVQNEWQRALKSQLRVMNIHLNNLELWQKHASDLGAAAKTETGLQYKIEQSRVKIIEPIQGMAATINEAYGILVTTPQQLADMLDA